MTLAQNVITMATKTQHVYPTPIIRSQLDYEFSLVGFDVVGGVCLFVCLFVWVFLGGGFLFHDHSICFGGTNLENQEQESVSINIATLS